MYLSTTITIVRNYIIVYYKAFIKSLRTAYKCEISGPKVKCH